MKVFFDLDGVLFSFIDALHKHLKIPFNINEYPYTKGVFDIFPEIAKVHGIKESEIYKVMRGEDFWTSLEILPKGKKLFDEVVKRAGKENVFLLTKPVVGMPQSFSGKYKLVATKLEGWTKNLILTTTSKGVLDHPNNIFIDDSDENINDIKEGKGILFPQPWNSRYSEVNISEEDLINEVLSQVKKIKIKSILSTKINLPR